MNFDEYRQIQAVNWSRLKWYENPRLAKWREDHPEQDKESFKIGNATHCLLLEDSEFASRYFVGEDHQCEATTKKGSRCSKNAAPGDVYCSQHGGTVPEGITVLTAAQGETVRHCRDSIMGNADARALIEYASTEHTIQWVDPETGVLCKARLDGLLEGAIFDVKTSGKPLSEFAREAARMMYHGQSAFYGDGAVVSGAIHGESDPYSIDLGDGVVVSDGYENVKRYIIAVETIEPYDSAVFRLTDAVIEAGRSLYRSFLHSMISCAETGFYPGRYQGITWLELPPWAPGMRDDDE